MKWYILPEFRDDMIRSAYRGGRGGHRGSSNPSSPNQLNYVNQGPKEMAARDQGSARKRKVSPSGSPQPRSSLRDSHMTPDRSSRRLLPEEAPSASDGSPLPRFRKGNAAGGAPRSPTLGVSVPTRIYYMHRVQPIQKGRRLDAAKTHGSTWCRSRGGEEATVRAGHSTKSGSHCALSSPTPRSKFPGWAVVPCMDRVIELGHHTLVLVILPSYGKVWVNWETTGEFVFQAKIPRKDMSRITWRVGDGV